MSITTTPRAAGPHILTLAAVAVLLACSGPEPTSVSASFAGASPGSPQLDRSAPSCVNVSGTLVGNVFTTQTVSGDLQGTSFAYSPPIATITGQAQHLETFHHFELADGSFRTVDRGIMAPVDRPLYQLNNRYEIVSGTGAWAGAHGFLRLHGSLIIDETFTHPENGAIDARYHGRICR